MSTLFFGSGRDIKVAGEERLLKLNAMDEFCLETYENAKLYKKHTKRRHDKHLVLLNLWFPIDGNVVMNCFLWAGGFSYYRRGAAEISILV